MTNELAIVVLLVGLAAGALAARYSGAQPWQGAVVILAGTALSFFVLIIAQVEGIIWPLLLSMVGSGIAGGALKLKGRQIVAIFLGSFIAQFIAGAIFLQAFAV